MRYNSELAETIAHLCKTDGLMESPIPGLKLFRSEISVPRAPAMYAPAICVVAQGYKQLYFGEYSRRYDPDNYLINSVPMPFEVEVRDASPESPYLGFAIEIDSYLISQLLIDMEHPNSPPEKTGEIIVSTKVTEDLQRCFLRLLRCIDNEMDMKVLAPALKREIFYEVLKGPHGDVLRNCVANHSGANRIAPVVHYIEENFHTPLDVDTIANYAGMSPSTLHDHFKQVTSMSPMQFVKSLRLHKAHSLLLSGNQASEASYQVGYNSPSQFSREFKRFFGESPRVIQASAAG